MRDGESNRVSLEETVEIPIQSFTLTPDEGEVVGEEIRTSYYYRPWKVAERVGSLLFVE
jgi:hypothetical protein